MVILLEADNFWKKIQSHSPIPSLGTHLDKDGISPGINWDEVIKESQP